MSSTINASVDGIVLTASSTAAMNLATGGTNRLSIDTSGNVGIATGNLTFSSTGQRITGDFSNATIANRLLFQTNVVDTNTTVGVIPNGTGNVSTISLESNATATNNSFGQISIVGGTDYRINSGIRGTGTYLPITFYTGGSERMRLDTSGNLLLGTATGLAGSRFTVVGGGTQLSGGTTAQEGVRIQRATGYATFTGINNDNNAYNGLQFFTSASAAATIDTSGNVGIGTASPSAKLDVATSINLGLNYLNVGYDVGSGSGYVSGYNVTYSGGVKNVVTGALNAVWYSPDSIRFHTNSSAAAGTTAAERMRITSAGRVGIGTASPNVGLEVSSSATEDSRALRVAYDSTYYFEIRNLGAAGARLRSNNGQIVFNITGTDYAELKTSGEFVTGGTTDNGAYNLQCNGTGVWGAGAYVNGSDARLKDNIQSLDSGLDVVKAMRPVTFQYKPEYSKDQNVQPGFIAQELQTAMAGKPYLEGVVQEGTNHLNVAYQSIIPILVKAIQELEAKVAALESK